MIRDLNALYSKYLRLLAGCAAVSLLGIGCVSFSPSASAAEIGLDGSVREKMDSWELNRLNAADAAFAKALKAGGGKRKPKNEQQRIKLEKAKRKALQQASAAYEGFLKEFPQSQPAALAYALYRQARAEHMDNKRNTARRIYQDVIEFFPNQIEIATAAIYYKGVSFREDGELEDAVRAWGAIARDKQYRKLPLAADALIELGSYLITHDRAPEAIGLLTNMAIDFRTTNPRSSGRAIALLLKHYVRTEPNERALRELYLKTRGFSSKPTKNFAAREPSDALTDMNFWKPVIDAIRVNAKFEKGQDEQRKTYFQYWSEAMEGRLAKDDTYQIGYLEFLREANGDRDAWLKSVVDLHDKNKGTKGFTRTLSFMKIVKSHSASVRHLYDQIEWGVMTSKQAVDTCRAMFGYGDFGPLSVPKVPLDGLNDSQRAEFGRFIYAKRKTFQQAGPLGMQVAESIEADELKNITLLQMIKNDPEVDIEKKLGYAKALKSSRKYSGEASKIAGDLLKGAKRYDEAISAYKGWGKEIAVNYIVAEVKFLKGDIAGCVGELEMLETSYAGEAPKAAMKIAQYYDKAKMDSQRNATIIRVLQKYKGTREHSSAHRWAENLGLNYRTSNSQE